MHLIYFCNNLKESAALYKVNGVDDKIGTSTKALAEKNAQSLFNFDLIEQQNSGINISDRALNYGDGTFTTMLIDAQYGMISFNEHLARLESSCKTLSINVNMRLLKQVLLSICQSFISEVIKHPLLIMKILVTRGEGGRGYMPPENSAPNLVLTLSNHSKSSFHVPTNSDQINAAIASIKLGHQPKLAGLKHTNRLEQVLAKLELRELQVEELLLTCQSDYVVEATSSNLFLFKNGKWYTPRLNNCGVSGVMRNAFMRYLDSMGENVEEIDIQVDELPNFDSVFTCNALNPMVPIKQISVQQGKKTVCFKAQPILNLYTGFIQFLIKRTAVKW